MDYITYVKGAISGMVGLILSHPFDTIKTNIQAKKEIKYNPRFLYRGITSPLLGICIENAIVFGTYNNMYAFLKNKYNCNSVMNDIISGGFAGCCASLVVSPYEKIKIIMQTSNKLSANAFHPKNLFRLKELSATLTRETPGFAIYFLTYNQIEKTFYNGHYTLNGSFFAGGLSGSIAWCFIYPQDMIKTRMQSGVSGNKSFFQIAKDIKSEGGLLRFYKGFHFSLMRAFPLHAGTFATMEYLKRFDKKV